VGADENADPSELNIEPLNLAFGSSVTIVKSMDDVLDDLD
jgi:hypothetical protein